jgi:hypothetical protein
MADRKILTLMGATGGVRGGGLVRAILTDSRGAFDLRDHPQCHSDEL